MQFRKRVFQKNAEMSKELLFIHIPKNAGTSINNILGITDPTHIKAYELIEQKGNKYFNDFFSFGIVRNPFDRFISLFNYSKMKVSFYHNNINPGDARFGKHLDYNLLKNANLDECVNYLMEGRLQHDKAWNHWMPQYTWLYDRNGKECLVDEVYKLEKLEELERDLKNRKYNFKSIPQLNQSLNINYRELICKDSRKFLEEYYEKDLELFKYKF